uniref:Probable magnesium-protoporphyrin IX monomethyl ester [oxidative] cyclase n=1 Tax=Olisthodiscus luteus TaxID=83000 RepID=A0A7U0KRT2_OLILU|nr:Mg-protoporphyrin IX monomethyl ester oxidative cyclase [Olisthodiscus luteus]YP_010152834.1 Mg-protoporphyrin IX monomethyl ester oxidative cyclase [Olisthodiscus luteus]QQW50457.1 Mg-protoporphyrin IX monomethyl ester oxidative cyclase [Olisthodiscus luteus]QQW50495.1 Mg-protoporphyrin IX monomethyl ester oxidative cyclase [Olisthodiscus luteus]
MTTSLKINEEAKKIENKTPFKETLLTPRFYTTDFDEMSKLDVSNNIEEVEAILEEFRLDYNQKHFIRDNEFLKSWEFLDAETRSLFVEFLERSCTAEFSGFLLYKELSRNLAKSNPILAEGFAFMSRDEARHAGFLNKAMSDFNLSLDLGFLTKSRKYTFFSPNFILYATYLSEKIGYWRYITIYRHLEKQKENRVYPIFKFFESWCQDENRHGDFFAAIIKAQPSLLETFTAKLWCRFFLLSVYATMYLNDLQRSGFYQKIGLDAKKFDQHVIRKTNQSSEKLFKVVLDVDHPKFFKYLDICAEANLKLYSLNNSGGDLFSKLNNYLIIISHLCKLFLLPPKNIKG